MIYFDDHLLRTRRFIGYLGKSFLSIIANGNSKAVSMI